MLFISWEEGEATPKRKEAWMRPHARTPSLQEKAEIVGLKSPLHGLIIHAMGIQGGADFFDPQCGSLGSCGLV